MAGIDSLVAAIIRMEGSELANSVNMRMVRDFGLWNMGHLVWAGQTGARPVTINGRQWAGWPTREGSIEGIRRQIRLDASRNLTLRQFIYKYAPPTENRSEQYVNNVSLWTGYPPDTPLKFIVDGGIPGPSPVAVPEPAPAPTPDSKPWSITDWLSEIPAPSADPDSAPSTQVLASLAIGGAVLLVLLIQPRED